ncbi:hypothetical protein JOF48_001941 [Arthrobacter stackebrandtii]|uniref:DUF4190 domain-containing protein n=1 Tax=Arthrobacter stackebrandtii TaxID=272161 RepID=A0ABS4YXG8_9MICC|nr:DUF4190 domain-containing protein [Arthrobacter stackebrandtii]MBP2413142.1 hypothetical protein [Arthrobacter stackebrandtii]
MGENPTPDPYVAPGTAAPNGGTPGYGYGQPAPYPGAQVPDAPEFATPQYGTPAYGAPQPGEQPFGTPAYGAPQYGTPPYGAQPFETSPYGAQKPGMQQPYYGVPPYDAPAPGGTNTLAILSLVFAFVFNIAGIVLGHMALKQISQTNEQGRGLAVAGLVISYISLAGSVLFFGIMILGFIGTVVGETYSY